MVVSRINHFPEIAQKKKWDRPEAIRQLMYHCKLSWPTAAKWADGDTDVDLAGLERIAAWLSVSKDELLETKT